jgi:hypothetical protein
VGGSALSSHQPLSCSHVRDSKLFDLKTLLVK